MMKRDIRRMRWRCVVCVAALFLGSQAGAQTVLHGRLVSGPGGPTTGLFDVNGGVLSSLYFSVANQAQSGGVFSPFGLPEMAILRQISSFGGTPSPIPGAPSGFFPSAVPEPVPGLSFFLGALALAGASRSRGSLKRGLD